MMGEDANTGSTDEQTTAADIDQGALAQLKRQLGELTGQELDLTEAQLINLFTAIGTRTDSDGSVTYRHLVLPRKFCSAARSMDVTGQAATAGNGAVTFLLSSFICATRTLGPPAGEPGGDARVDPAGLCHHRVQAGAEPSGPRGLYRP